MVERYFEPDEVWEAFCVISASCESVLALNSDSGVVISATPMDMPKGFAVEIEVAIDGDEIDSCFVYDGATCQKKVKEYYEYLDENPMALFSMLESAMADVTNLADEKNDEEEEKIPTDEELNKMAIKNREDELTFAISDLIDAFDPQNRHNAAMNDEDNIEELKEIVLMWAHFKGFMIYRPAEMVDEETGEEFYTDYPYECLTETEPGKFDIKKPEKEREE